MKTALHAAIVLLALPLCSAQAVVDRMVAVVNKHVVLQSEVEQEVRIDFLLRGRPVEQITYAETAAMLDILIDQALLQQQIVPTSMLDPEPEELAAQLAKLSADIPGAQEDARWRSLLTGYGLDQHDLEIHIATQVRILRFVDLRFRRLARVDREDVRHYYDETLLLELKRQNQPAPPLDQVYGQIERILTEKQINDSLATWMSGLRGQANIQKLTVVSAPTEPKP